VAPGVKSNRPPFGKQPVRHTEDKFGNKKDVVNTWYEGLGMMGNTSLNPYFYGTYLAETLPGEPVHRTKSQAFQADAVCAMNQLAKDHFQQTHTYRLEWQPGNGGRLDWYIQGYKKTNETTGETFYMTGDGKGKDWYPAYTITDEKLKLVEGAQIPVEPSYLIFNTAVSTSWGFPFDTPDWCPPCFDCGDPKCRCNFNDGFCDMIATPGSKGAKEVNAGVNMLIDSVRVYQSRDDNAHTGDPHSLGCDPPEYPTRQYIKANEYKYSRPPPWVYEDKGPLSKTIQNGGASCEVDADCGGLDNTTATNNATTQQDDQEESSVNGKQSFQRGFCGTGQLYKNHKPKGWGYSRNVCVCNAGFTGPKCLAVDHKDNYPSAMKISAGKNMFHQMESIHIPSFIFCLIGAMALIVMGNMHYQVKTKRTDIAKYHRERTASMNTENTNTTTGTSTSMTQQDGVGVGSSSASANGNGIAVPRPTPATEHSALLGGPESTSVTGRSI
jgi:hypothetical protein